MKIILTGNEGFIGSRLEQGLKEAGHEVIGYDLKSGWDIRDREQLKFIFLPLLGQEVMVFHLAALAGVREGERIPDEYLSTNIVGTQNIIDMCKEYNVRHLVSFSSSSVFGNTPPPNDEDATLNPIAVYGYSKMVGEWLVKHSKLDASIIRPFTMYGENGRPEQVIMKWVNCIKEGKPIPFYGDGTTKRGYTYVGDLVEALVTLAQLVQSGQFDNNGVEVYNLGGSEIISLEDLLSVFKEVAPDLQVDRQPLPFADVFENWADTSKAEKQLGFNPIPLFRERVKKIITEELSK